MLAVLAFLAPGGAPHAGSRRSLPPDLVQLGVVTGPVYRVAARSSEGGAWTEIVAPVSGQCRLETGERVEIVGGRTRAVVEPQNGVSVRTGSRRFLGYIVRDCPSAAPLRERLRRGEAIRAGDVVVLGPHRHGTVEGELGDPSAAFAVPLERLTSYDIERAVGERPWQPIRAYWFGRSISRRRAVRAVEHFDLGFSGRPPRRVPSSVHIFLYELASARGRSSAEPGRSAPVGELQVVSQPIHQVNARGTIAAINGRNGEFRYKPWPRTRIRLANGERATLVPARWESTGRIRDGFLVLTKTTLVGVSGRVRLERIPDLARRLRPLTRR